MNWESGGFANANEDWLLNNKKTKNLGKLMSRVGGRLLASKKNLLEQKRRMIRKKQRPFVPDVSLVVQYYYYSIRLLLPCFWYVTRFHIDCKSPFAFCPSGTTKTKVCVATVHVDMNIAHEFHMKQSWGDIDRLHPTIAFLVAFFYFWLSVFISVPFAQFLRRTNWLAFSMHPVPLFLLLLSLTGAW